MKKFLVVLVLIMVSLGGAYGQTAYEAKKAVLQGGFGFSPLGFLGETQGIPLSFSLDYGVTKDFSVGLYVGKHSTRDVHEDWIFGEVGWEYNYTSIAGRVSFHFDFFGSEKIDTYGAISLGYCILSESGTPKEYEEFIEKLFGPPGESFFAYGGGLGIRYFITPNIGVYLEGGFGAGFDLLAIGISFKF